MLCSGNGLVPSGNRPLPEAMLTQISIHILSIIHHSRDWSWQQQGPWLSIPSTEATLGNINGLIDIGVVWAVQSTRRSVWWPLCLCVWPTSWWGHQIFRVTSLCGGVSQVSGEFPSQRPVTRNPNVFFDLHLNKRLSKQSRRRWFETPPRSLWHQCNVPSAHMHTWVEKLTYIIIGFTLFCVIII